MELNVLWVLFFSSREITREISMPVQTWLEISLTSCQLYHLSQLYPSAWSVAEKQPPPFGLNTSTALAQPACDLEPGMVSAGGRLSSRCQAGPGFFLYFVCKVWGGGRRGRKKKEKHDGNSLCECPLPHLLSARTPEVFLHFELLPSNMGYCFQGMPVRQGRI